MTADQWTVLALALAVLAGLGLGLSLGLSAEGLHRRPRWRA